MKNLTLSGLVATDEDGEVYTINLPKSGSVVTYNLEEPGNIVEYPSPAEVKYESSLTKSKQSNVLDTILKKHRGK
jgi:hypothetical protein